MELIPLHIRWLGSRDRVFESDAPLARTTVGAGLASGSLVEIEPDLGDDRLRRGVDQVVEEGAIA